MNWKRLFAKTRAAKQIVLGMGKPSFSQFGEDRILEYLFHTEGIKMPTYLDVGANLPVLGSNTFLFYNRGCSGVLIEPEPSLAADLRKARPRDTVLEMAIGLSDDAPSQPFYVFPKENSPWNTFSPVDAELRKASGFPYERVIDMPLININTVFEKYFPNRAPDLMSVDIEGLDLDVMKSMDFQKHRPLAIVLEVLRLSDSDKIFKDERIAPFMLEQGYSLYADTYVNAIFKREG